MAHGGTSWLVLMAHEQNPGASTVLSLPRSIIGYQQADESVCDSPPSGEAATVETSHSSMRSLKTGACPDSQVPRGQGGALVPEGCPGTTTSLIS